METKDSTGKRRRLVDTSTVPLKDRVKRFRELNGERTSVAFAADISIHGKSATHQPMKPMLMHHDEPRRCPVVSKRAMNIVYPHTAGPGASNPCAMQESCHFRQIMSSAVPGYEFIGEVFDPPVSPKVDTDRCLLCTIYGTLLAIGNPVQEPTSVVNPFRVHMGCTGEFEAKDVIHNQPGIYGCFPLIDTFMWVVTTDEQQLPCIRLACEDFQVGAGLDHPRVQIRSIDTSSNMTPNGPSPKACSVSA